MSLLRNLKKTTIFNQLFTRKDVLTITDTEFVIDAAHSKYVFHKIANATTEKVTILQNGVKTDMHMEIAGSTASQNGVKTDIHMEIAGSTASIVFAYVIGTLLVFGAFAKH